MAVCHYGRGRRGGKAVVALDCEMVRCIPDRDWLQRRRQLGSRKKNPDSVSIAARCAIVDYDGRSLYYKTIRPNLHVVDYLSDISGVSSEDMRDATPYDVARSEIAAILGNKIVVGHAVRNDFNSLQLTFAQEDIRDTATCYLLRDRAGSIPEGYPMASLGDLAAGILGREVHKLEQPHSPYIDAKIAMELYRVVEDEWEKAETAQMGW